MRALLSACSGLLLGGILLAACGGPSSMENTPGNPFENLPSLQSEVLAEVTDEVFPADAVEEGYYFSDYFRHMTIGPDGSFFVLNTGQMNILHFGPDGSFLDAIGQEGEGPGEFQIWPNFDLLSPDSLVALDYRKSEVMLFTREEDNWKYRDGFLLEPREGYDPESIHYLSADLLAIDSEPDISYRLNVAGTDSQLTRMVSLHTLDGNLLKENWLTLPSDEMFVYKSEIGGGAASSLPYGARTLLDAGPEGRLHHSWTNRFSIHMHDPHGGEADSIRHASFTPTLREEFRQEAIDNGISVNMGSEQDQMMELFTEAIPTEAPALRDMHVDRDTGRIIVRRYVFEEDAPNWMLLDADGTRLGTFRLPENLEVYDFRHGKILGAMSGDEILPTVQVIALQDMAP